MTKIRCGHDLLLQSWMSNNLFRHWTTVFPVYLEKTTKITHLTSMSNTRGSKNYRTNRKLHFLVFFKLCSILPPRPSHYYSLRNQYRQRKIFRFRDKNTKVISHFSQFHSHHKKDRQSPFCATDRYGQHRASYWVHCCQQELTFHKFYSFAPRKQCKKTEYKIT